MCCCEAGILCCEAGFCVVGRRGFCVVARRPCFLDVSVCFKRRRRSPIVWLRGGHLCCCCEASILCCLQSRHLCLWRDGLLCCLRSRYCFLVSLFALNANGVSQLFRCEVGICVVARRALVCEAGFRICCPGRHCFLGVSVCFERQRRSPIPAQGWSQPWDQLTESH